MPRVDDGLVDQQLGVAVVGGVDLILVAGVGDDGVAVTEQPPCSYRNGLSQHQTAELVGEGFGCEHIDGHA